QLRAQQQQQAMQQWQYQASQNQAQRKIVEQQQAELDRQRALDLSKTFDNFRNAVGKAQTEDEYRNLVQMYSDNLRAKGYRISPQYFYDNFRYAPPSDQQKLEAGLKKFYANPDVAAAIKADPTFSQKQSIGIDTVRDGVKQRVFYTIPEALKATGMDITM